MSRCGSRYQALGSTKAGQAQNRVVGRRMDTQLGLVQRSPLATGPQDMEDRIGASSIRDTQSSPAKVLGIDVDGQQGWSTAHSSSEMRNPVVVALSVDFVA